MNTPSFPKLEKHTWRSDWPYIITLTDGKSLSAYPAVGKVNEDEEFCFGESCKDPVWYVADNIVEHDAIKSLCNARLIAVSDVADWKPLNG